jgi:pimeloyl-ACP methyl ester carboxylesterase
MQEFKFINPRIIWLLLLLYLTLPACQRNTAFFFVKNKGAVMPVKVSGNTEANTYIVFLAGGPSGDGHLYRSVFPFFRKSIEPHYAMVYYDQRGGGNTQGTYDTTTLQLAQLSEDLDRIVSVLKKEHRAEHIYLMGYSYGGALGMTYLMNRDYRQNIRGFISIEGAFDRAKQVEYQNQLLSYWLNEWKTEGLIGDYEALTNGYNCQKKQDPIACRQDSIQLMTKVEELIKAAEKTNRFQLNPGRVRGLLGFTFFSQSNLLFSTTNENQNARYFHEEFDRLVLSDRVADITTPVLFICGRYDTNVPVFDAQNIYSKIGTAEGNKKIVILKQSGHLPMITEPDELSKHMLDFINQLKK